MSILHCVTKLVAECLPEQRDCFCDLARLQQLQRTIHRFFEAAILRPFHIDGPCGLVANNTRLAPAAPPNVYRRSTDYRGDESHLYIGFLENNHRNRWIFTSDRKTGLATLRGGDIGWNTVIDVTNGSSPEGE